LWAARFYKTRSLAAQAIEAGQARVDGERVKPAHAVRIGDRVVVRKDGLSWDVSVASLSDRRGGAPEAARLYAELQASVAARAEEIARRKAAAATAPVWPGRPTKRDRRKLREFLDEA
jgi:ribosome-associated heat shock protein Hsp15